MASRTEEMSRTNKSVVLTVSVSMAVLLFGCRPPQEKNVAPVSGTVRLDGESVENVKVLFVSLERNKDGKQGPVAFAVTDAKGHYTLAHRGGGHGAAVGRNQVWLTTRRIEEKKMADGETELVEVSPERIPSKYNTETELVVDVPANGMKNVDFELKSGESH